MGREGFVGSIFGTAIRLLRRMGGHDAELAALKSKSDKYKKYYDEIYQQNYTLEKKIEKLKQHVPPQHPKFGTLLADFGNRQVYSASLDLVKSISVWDKQRAFRRHRAQAIAKDKMKSEIGPGFAGCITIFEFQDTGLTGILDGQHRIGAQQIMSSAGVLDPTEKNILLEVFPVPHGKQAEIIFKEINKAEPVRSIDLPSDENKDSISSVNTAVEQLFQRFPLMFKPSSRCRAPHVHIDSLRDEIFQADICSRYTLRDSEALMHWIMNQNNTLSTLSENQWIERYPGKIGVNFHRALAKAKKNDFFLGMDKLWIN